MTRITDGRDAGAFITASLDDFGLDPYAFRIYARIVRRAGTKQGCFESIDNMARACSISRDRVYVALKLLIKHRLIEKEPHAGRPSSYYLTPSSEWIPLPDLSRKRDTEPITDPGQHLSRKRDTPITDPGHPPITDPGHEGINKRDQLKDHHEGGKNSADDDAVADPFYTGQVRQIAREVVKTQRQINGVRNFITDAPWGDLAKETGKDPTTIFHGFEGYLKAVYSDKKDPDAYAKKICSALYEKPGSELACKPWIEFADFFRKNLTLPPPPKKREARQPQITPIPDREASKKAIQEAKRGLHRSA